MPRCERYAQARAELAIGHLGTLIEYALEYVEGRLGLDDERPPIVKACACGRFHTLAQWQALPLVAADWYGHEARNCVCGSTIMVELTGNRLAVLA